MVLDYTFEPIRKISCTTLIQGTLGKLTHQNIGSMPAPNKKNGRAKPGHFS
jgi:hypothetical protein